MSPQGFERDERARIARALQDGDAAPACPACGERLSRTPVRPPASVAYVRHRVLLVCPGCRRSAAFDVRADGPP